jgi:hypothetical protein
MELREKTEALRYAMWMATSGSGDRADPLAILVLWAPKVRRVLRGRRDRPASRVRKASLVRRARKVLSASRALRDFPANKAR